MRMPRGSRPLALGVRQQLERIFRSSVAAAHGGRAVARCLERNDGGEISIAGRPLPSNAGIWVAALGKAAPDMLEALESFAADRIHGGMAVTPDAHLPSLSTAIEVRAAGHPVPDARGDRAARDLLTLVSKIPPQDALLVLLSGGTSALTSCPAPGLRLDDLKQLTRLLLASGAEIHQVNTVRKHCSRFSGGRLAAAAGTRRIDVLSVSDVTGDLPEVIGSGPCSPDPSTFADALDVVTGYGLEDALPRRVMRYLISGAQGQQDESLSARDPRLNGVAYHVIASNRDARGAACEAAGALGLRVLDLGEVLRGEARVMGKRLAALAHGLEVGSPTLLVAGGETVVRVRGAGRGGRNQELALAMAMAWSERPGTPCAAVLAAGTDGRDGLSEVAGAFADEHTVRTAAQKGLDARRLLDDNDSGGFFAGAGGAVLTGPTGTNVMDLALLRVDAGKDSRY